MSGAPSSAPSPAALALTPAERLQASRARLRHALERARGSSRRRSGPDAEGDEDPGTFNFIDTVERVLRDTWAFHPLRRAWRVLQQIVGPVAVQQLRPIVSSHPLRVMAIAAGVGGLLIWLRPWRLLPQAAVVSMLIPQRALWQALMASGLDKLADGDWLAQWVKDTLGDEGSPMPPTAADGAAPTPQAAPSPAAPEHDVLQPVPSPADVARAA